MPSATDPKKMAEELRAFQKSAKLFSRRRPNLIEKYNNRWVAVLDGEVIADGESMGEVLQKLKDEQVDARGAMVRFLTTEPRTFIL